MLSPMQSIATNFGSRKCGSEYYQWLIYNLQWQKDQFSISGKIQIFFYEFDPVIEDRHFTHGKVYIIFY